MSSSSSSFMPTSMLTVNPSSRDGTLGSLATERLRIRGEEVARVPRVGGRCMGPTWIGWQWMHLDHWGLESEECKGACVWYCLGGNKGGEGIRRTKRDWFWRFWLTPQQKRLLVFQHQHRLCKTIDVNQFSW